LAIINECFTIPFQVCSNEQKVREKIGKEESSEGEERKRVNGGDMNDENEKIKLLKKRE
jgi:hypothetical protein